MGGAQVALLVALLAAQGWAEEIVLTLNTKKAVHSLSDKFLSVTLDPATLMQGDELGSGTVCTLSMARGLAPAYLRLAGRQSNHLRFQRALFPDEQRDNYTITEAHWLVLNHFAQQTGLELVVALAADQRVDGAWDPRNSLELIAFSDKLGFNVSAWQLGYELQRLRDCSGAQLGRDVTRLRHILDAFPRYSASVVVAPDVLSYKSREDVEWLRAFIEEAGTSLGVLSWHPKFPMNREHSADSDEDTEVYFPPDSLVWEKEALYRALGRHAGFKRPLWIAESHSGECRGWFLDALQWAHKLGVAARIGANTIFRQPDMRVLLQPTPDYWVSLLHKKLVGGTVLDARLAHGNRSHVHAFSHCATTPLGGVTVWAVNLLDQRVRVTVRAAWGKASVDKTDVNQYVLTAAGDDGLHSGRTLLNGELLALNPSGELPSIQPRIRRLGRAPSMTMPPRSIAFWVFPDAQVRPCMDVSHKKMVPKEKVKQENSEEDVSGDYEPDKYKYGHADREYDSRERYQSATKVKRKIHHETNKRGHSDSTSEEYNSAEAREILFGAKNKKKNSEDNFKDDQHTPRYSLKTKNTSSKSGKEYYDEVNNKNSLTGRINTKFSHGSSESDSNESDGKTYKNNIKVRKTNAQDLSESKSKFVQPTNTYPKKYQPKHTGEVEGKTDKHRQERKKYESSESESQSIESESQSIESEPLKKFKNTDHKNIPLSNGPKNLDSNEDRSQYQQNKKKSVPFQDQIKRIIDNIKHDDIIKNNTKYDHARQINETKNERYNYAIIQHDNSLSSSSENNSSIITQAERSHSSEYRPPHTTESHDAKMESERYLKAKFANLVSKSPEPTSEAPENVVVMEILHNGLEEGNGEKKSRVARSLSESGPYIIPGLSPDLYQQQSKVKSISKRRKEESVRHPRKTKKPKEISKHGKKKDDDHQESVGYDPNKPVSYEDADHLFGSPLSHNTQDDSFPRGDVYIKEAGESQEKNNDYDYVGDEDEKKDHDHSHSEEEATDNEELPSKYHGLGHFFENVRITKPEIKENLVNYGELWEAEGYGEFEETHNTVDEEEDSKVIPHEVLSEEHDRKIKNKTANMLKSYFDDTRDSKELDMEEEHRRQKMAEKGSSETAEEYEIEDDKSEHTGTYPCMHPHSLPYKNPRQLTHQDSAENKPAKENYRTKRHGDGIVEVIGNALTEVPVITRKLLSNGKTSLMLDNGAEGEERLSKIVDHVVQTMRDVDADYDPKLVSLKLESEHPKEIVKRSVDSTDGNHLSRVHKKQLNSFSEELDMAKENNLKTVNQNVNINNFINQFKTAQKTTHKGNAFYNTDSTKFRDVGALSPAEQSRIESDKTKNKGRGAGSQAPVPENPLLSQNKNESESRNKTLEHTKLVRTKRSDVTEENYEPDESETLQKKVKKGKLNHLIYEKKLKDAECKKHEEDKIYKEKKGFEKRQKKVKLIKKKGDKKKKKKKLKFKESNDGHSKKRLHYKKGDKGKKTLIKYKRSLYLIDDNDLRNGALEGNSLAAPYDVQHDFKLLESENPYKESTVNGQDFIYFIVDKDDPTAESNKIKGVGEEIQPESSDPFVESELRSLVKSGSLQKGPVRNPEIIYEFVPEHLLDPTFQQEHEVRVILDSLGNGLEYELTQNEYSVPLGEGPDNIPTLNSFNSQDDGVDPKFNVITGEMGQLLEGIADTGRIFPVERDVEYRIGDIGEYADDYLVYGSGKKVYDIGEGNAENYEHHQQNIVWPYEEVTEFEISGIDEATHEELSKILGTTMKVLVEMPPPGIFSGSIIEPEFGNENEEHENDRKKRSLINREPYIGANEWYENGDTVVEQVLKKPYKLDAGLRYKYRDYAKGSDDDVYPNETLIKEIIENEAINNEIMLDPDRGNNVHREKFIPRNREPINYAPVTSTTNGTVDDDEINSTMGIQTQEEKLGEENTEEGSETAATDDGVTTPEVMTSETSDQVPQEDKSNFFDKIMHSLSKAYSYVKNLVFPS